MVLRWNNIGDLFSWIDSTTLFSEYLSSKVRIIRIEEAALSCSQVMLDGLLLWIQLEQIIVQLKFLWRLFNKRRHLIWIQIFIEKFRLSSDEVNIRRMFRFARVQQLFRSVSCNTINKYIIKQHSNCNLLFSHLKYMLRIVFIRTKHYNQI